MRHDHIGRIGRIGRWLRRGALLLACVLGVIVALVPLVFALATKTHAGRDLVRAQLLGALEGVLNGEIVVDEIEHLSLTRVHLRGLRVIDRTGRTVASAQRARATLAPWQLAVGRVEIRRLWVDGAHVDLGDLSATDGAGGGLLSVIPSDDDDAQDEASSSITLTMQRIEISSATVTTRISDDQYVATRLQARGALTIDDEAELHVSRVHSHVMRNGQDIATLAGHTLRYCTTDAASGVLKAWLGTSQVKVDARIEASDGDKPQVIDAALIAHRLQPAVAHAFGIDTAPWNGPVNLRAEAHGTTDALDFVIDLGAPRGRLNTRGTWRAPLSFDITARFDQLDLRSASSVDIAPISGSVNAQLDADAALSTARFSAALVGAKYDARALPSIDVQGSWSQANGLTIPTLRAHYRKAALNASLRLDTQDNVTAAAEVRVDALEDIALLSSQGLRGRLNATLAAHFKLDDPTRATVDAHVRGTGLAVHDAHVPYADLRIEGGPLRYRTQLNMREHGRIDMHVTRRHQELIAYGRGALRLPGVEWLSFALNRLAYDVEQQALRVADLHIEHAGANAHVSGSYHARKPTHLRISADVPDIERVAAPWTDADVSGRLKIDATIEGALEHPSVAIDARYQTRAIANLRDVNLGVQAQAALGRNMALHTTFDARTRFEGDADPVRVKGGVNYQPRRIDLKLTAEDKQGALFRAAIGTDLKGGALPRVPEDVIALLNERAWETDLWLAVRRIDELPGVRRLGLDPALLPARVSAQGRLAHAPGQEPEGELKLRALFLNAEPEDEAETSTCAYIDRQEITLDAQMRDGKLSGTLRGMLADREALRVYAESKAPLTEWLTPVEPKPLSVIAKAIDLRLSDVPLACERVTGVMNGTVTIDRALSHDAAVKAELRAKSIRIANADPFNAHVFAKVDRNTLLSRAELTSSQGNATIRGRIAMDATSTLPMPDMDQPIDVRAQLRKIELAALLAVVPDVRARAGTIEGDVVVAGLLSSPTVNGDLMLRDATVLLPELGQPFERVTGRVLLKGKTLQLLRTRVHDRDGWADVSAELTLGDDDSLKIKADMRADDFPIRRGGVILARFDGRAGLDAHMQTERSDVAVVLRGATIVLEPSGNLAGVQALAEHEEIHLVDDTWAEGALPEGALSPTSTREVEDDSELHVSIDAREPSWIRRDDFSLLVATHLNLVMNGDDAPAISGSVEIERGFIELMGQLFDVERGRIAFAGGHDVEPTLEIVAHRRVPGGGKVTVEAGGTLRTPELRFMVDGAPVTAGEAVAAAAGSRASDSSGAAVEQQVGAVASGLIASVLTLGARRGFGEWVPILAIEDNAQETRVRAGIEARRLIPKFLRHVVVDAYVEGILSATKDDDSASSQSADTQTGSAVLLELRFPNNLVAETQYGPGSRWSADFSWEP